MSSREFNYRLHHKTLNVKHQQARMKHYIEMDKSLQP
jgi:hypothetical protein